MCFFLPLSVGRKVVATVCMVQKVSLLLPVDYKLKSLKVAKSKDDDSVCDGMYDSVCL